jgi:hypothetical protein
MKYLSEMTDEQTLVALVGASFRALPSHKDAPRVVVTNGMVVPNYSSPGDYDRLAALGVTSYGQMTAGSFMYIGPHGDRPRHRDHPLERRAKVLGHGAEALAGRVLRDLWIGRDERPPRRRRR